MDCQFLRGNNPGSDHIFVILCEFYPECPAATHSPRYSGFPGHMGESPAGFLGVPHILSQTRSVLPSTSGLCPQLSPCAQLCPWERFPHPSEKELSLKVKSSFRNPAGSAECSVSFGVCGMPGFGALGHLASCPDMLGKGYRGSGP